MTWAAAEHRRRIEADNLSRAMSHEAQAVQQLAAAIRSERDADLLERILPRLTEATRYAVRQQLKGTGLIK